MNFVFNSIRYKLGNGRKLNLIRMIATKNPNFESEHDRKSNKSNFRRGAVVVGGLALAVGIAYGMNGRRKHVQLKSVESVVAGSFRADLPKYTQENVAAHTTKETGIWVTYKQGVYDITQFVSQHPGGEQILLAAGSSVEPFWMLYAVHKTEQIYNLLETMRIGNIDYAEVEKSSEDESDPYYNEPKRHDVLTAHSEKPFNAEPPAYLLTETFYTPNEIFYVRNHLPVPEVDPETYELEVAVEGEKKILTFTLDEIKKLPKHTIAATVMCAGNRRSDMAQYKAVKGLNWGAAAVGNATWSGARLRDVLKLAGVNEDSPLHHVQFEGLDYDTTGNPYGASIPIWKALDKRGDVILAYEMNSQPLSRDHGFPIRAVVPGVVGARNVKWLGRIIVAKDESDSHWQQKDYKGFCPTCDWDKVDFSKSPAIQELPVISAICKPSRGDEVEVRDGHILVQGYAWSGGGQKIVRVDVTIDGGDTWYVANIDFQGDETPPMHWSWTLWTAKIPVSKNVDKVEIWSKAVDSAYNTQPEDSKNIWNLRGVLSNAYHRVPIVLKQR